MRKLLVATLMVALAVVIGAGAVLAGEKANNTIHVDLEPTEGSWATDASARMSIGKEYQENHPNWNDWPMSVGYAIKGLPCIDFGFDRVGGEDGGEHTYSLYIDTPEKGLVRLTNFNTKCADDSFESWLVLPDYSEAELRDGPVTFGIYVDSDNGTINEGEEGAFPILAGTSP